jgi:membrane protein YqaA with SNARE-associated domain
VLAIPNAVTHLVSIAGIVISIVSGQSNVFTAPEYFGGGDGANWLHVAAHLGVGMTVGAVVNWLIGSLVLFIARKVAKDPSAAARA